MVFKIAPPKDVFCRLRKAKNFKDDSKNSLPGRPVQAEGEAGYTDVPCWWGRGKNREYTYKFTVIVIKYSAILKQCR